MPVPPWFNAAVYHGNQLASLGQGWTSGHLDRALEDAGYGTGEVELYRHYMDYGRYQGVSAVPFFNADEYLRDLAALTHGTDGVTEARIETVEQSIRSSGLDPWQHYQTFGWLDGLNPSSAFDAARYLSDKLAQLGSGWDMTQLVESLRLSGLSPVEHYNAYGVNEGLAPFPAAVSLPDGSASLSFMEPDMLLPQALPEPPPIMDDEPAIGDGALDALFQSGMDPDSFPLPHEQNGSQEYFLSGGHHGIDFSFLLSPISEAGTGDEFLRNNGVSVKTLEHEEQNHVFSKEEFLREFGDKLAGVEANAKSLIILQDDQTYTFFYIANNNSPGAEAEAVSLLGSITTASPIIDIDPLL